MAFHTRSVKIVAGALLLFAAAAAQEWDVGIDEQPLPVESTQPAIDAAAPSDATSPPAEEVASAPVSEAAQPDATYIIKPGDTLWDLAFEFLGDPFQWQRIWQANGYITNPDLIYPGNQLQIPGRTAAPYTGEGLTSETTGALSSADALRGKLTNGASGYPGDSRLLSTMRSKNVLSRGFLRTVPFLWTKRDALGNMFPGNGIVNPPSVGRSYQLYSVLTFKPYSGVVYKIGDTIDIYTSLRFVRFEEKPANLVKRSGRACVQRLVEKECQALLFEMSEAIIGKERVSPAESFPWRIIDTLVEPPVSIGAKVFTRAEQTESPYLCQMIILDKGSSQGIEAGDVFGIYHQENEDSPARLSAIGSIGHVGTATSTLFIAAMIDNRIADDDGALLLRRARFSEQE